ncbi:MAG: FtsK/SpoIIIE domain-containing protein [Actinoallomurus sp.]
MATEPNDRGAPLRAVPNLDDDPAGTGEVHETGGEVAVPEETAPAEVLHGEVLQPWDRPPKFRPVWPAWIRVRDTRQAARRWAWSWTWHRAKFHAVRLPVYALKVVVYSPRGARRIAWTWSSWTFDREARPLRIRAVERGDIDAYLKLVRERNERVRLRGGSSAGVGGAAVIAAGMTWYYWPPTPYALVFGLLVLFGYFGRPDGRPFIDQAVITGPTAPRLTSDVVIRALGALGIAQINAAIKGGDGISFAAPITRDGPGWRADVDLPYGVTAVDIMERRYNLASGLRRPLGCVWPEPSDDAHAGRLVLWVGDQDLSKAKRPKCSLVKGKATSAFEALPFGTDQRGRPVDLTLIEGNMLIGAMPGMGKTFALRTLLLGLALDPLTELRVYELKGSGDLAPLEKVAHRYASGQDDGSIEQCVIGLREVVAECERRAETIKALPNDLVPENKTTPELAARRSLGLHPLAVAIDECQNLFSHEQYGAEAAVLCLRIIRLGRALGVILLLATQRPDTKSLPTSISANAGIRYCLRVMGQTENDMILGTSKYKNGVRATIFARKDKGIGYLIGDADDPQVVRGHYLDNPAADKICDLARALRAAAGRLSGHALGEDPDEGPVVNFIVDCVSVLRAGEEKVWLQVLADRLAELRPEVYGGMADLDPTSKAKQLSGMLRPYHVRSKDVWGDDGKGGKANLKGVIVDDVRAAAAEGDGDA